MGTLSVHSLTASPFTFSTRKFAFQYKTMWHIDYKWSCNHFSVSFSFEECLCFSQHIRSRFLCPVQMSWGLCWRSWQHITKNHEVDNCKCSAGWTQAIFSQIQFPGDSQPINFSCFPSFPHKLCRHRRIMYIWALIWKSTCHFHIYS